MDSPNESTELKFGFKLGQWDVKPMLGEFSDGQRSVRIQPKSMDVLLYLASKAGSVVEREELLRAVWGDRAQSDEPLTRCIGELRRALGDTRTKPEYIQTIPKRGYQLLKPVMSGSSNITEEIPLDQNMQQNNFWKGRTLLIGLALITLLILAIGTTLGKSTTNGKGVKGRIGKIGIMLLQLSPRRIYLNAWSI